MKNLSVLLSLFMLAVITSSISNNATAAEFKQVEKPIDPPALVLENLKGEKIDLADYKGKVVLVQFWATYCSPCRTEMPSMNKLMKKLKDAEVPFKILAVDMGESKAEVEKFVEEVKPEFTMLLVKKDEEIEPWNVFATPTNFLINPEGKIQYTLYGEFEWDSDEAVKIITELAASAKKDKTSDSDEKTDKATQEPKEDKTEQKQQTNAKAAS